MLISILDDNGTTVQYEAYRRDQTGKGAKKWTDREKTWNGEKLYLVVYYFESI